MERGKRGGKGKGKEKGGGQGNVNLRYHIVHQWVG